MKVKKKRRTHKKKENGKGGEKRMEYLRGF